MSWTWSWIALHFVVPGLIGAGIARLIIYCLPASRLGRAEKRAERIRQETGRIADAMTKILTAACGIRERRNKSILFENPEAIASIGGLRSSMSPVIQLMLARTGTHMGLSQAHPDLFPDDNVDSLDILNLEGREQELFFPEPVRQSSVETAVLLAGQCGGDYDEGTRDRAYRVFLEDIERLKKDCEKLHSKAHRSGIRFPFFHR